ncbi:Calcineurin subunit B [Hondaea fermentalgiana]|uniref:Calcineurin subunit B n=1 Tax=Hondaea fermentalgiana TaxID=2315210 RepID=A0A2R5GU80_9STRA|nr:Calcineurin subunit B [Hondaea fermentalgiana]|eukprot:GBG34427.1 Calcineurin subunit B [Hondaea fermentalgiana]
MSLNALRKLLCTPAGPKSEIEARQRRALGPQEQQLTLPGHKSLAVTSDAVKQKQLQNLAREKRAIDRQHSQAAADLEAKFKALVNGDHGKDEMDKTQMRKAFKAMGIKVEPELFSKLWMFFDADQNGSINAQEFVVTFCVLTYRGSAQDNVELAFRLFDTNRDGSISRREFNDMIAAVLGTRLRNVLNVELGRECFEDYLKSEVADELLRFVDAVEYLADEPSTSFSRDYADSLWDQYLAVGATDQVNVSDTVRNKCMAEISACGDGDDAVPASIFHDAAREAVALIEDGPLPRFKDKLRGSYSLFADRVWEDVGLDSSESMSEDQFRDWVNRTPGIFRFLDDLHVVMQEFQSK